MSCRRICRELLWLTRFGEIDQDSAPHLEHLAGCHACRDEIGFDRGLVQQLRLALAERVRDATPSPAAWDGVLDRMRRPEPSIGRVRAWTARLVVGLRAGTAMAGASLALILALNLEVVSILPPGIVTDTGGAEAAATRGQGVQPGAVQRWIEVAPIDPAGADDRTSTAAPVQPAEQLPIARFGRTSTPATDAAIEPAEVSEARPADVWQVLAVRLVPADREGISSESGTSSDEPGPEAPEPVPVPPVQGPS